MARYRYVRSDFFTHDRTAGLSPLARVVMLQGILANIAGILERSPRRLADTAGGKTTSKAVLEAIDELESRGIARWWPDLETLWVVEAADEQAMNDKAWRSVENLVRDMPPDIAAAFAERYRNRVSDTLSGTLNPQGTGAGDRGQEQGGRGQGGIPAADAAPPPPDPTAWIRPLWKDFERQRCEIQEHGRPRGLTDKQRITMKGLATHVRQALGEKRGHEAAVKSITAFLQDRLDEAKRKPDQVKWLVHASTWRTATWDRWRDFMEREHGRKTSDDYEARVEAEKKARVKARADDALTGLFAE